MHGAFINQTMQVKVLKRVSDIIEKLASGAGIEGDEASLPQINSFAVQENNSPPKADIPKRGQNENLEAVKSFLTTLIKQTITKIETSQQEKKPKDKKPAEKPDSLIQEA